MEEFKGRLRPDGNRPGPATGKAGLTASLTRRADAKAERSDPMAMSCRRQDRGQSQTGRRPTRKSFLRSSAFCLRISAVPPPAGHLLEQGQSSTDKSYPGDKPNKGWLSGSTAMWKLYGL